MKLFLELKEGFGNKIFNLIILHYFRIILDAEIYTKFSISRHDNITKKEIQKNIVKIFPNIFDNVNILNNWEEVDKIFNNEKRDIDILSEIDGNYIIDNHYKYYIKIIDLYLSIKSKNILKINESLINKKNDMVVHIRYGDKLRKYRHLYNIFRPELYVKIIREMLKKTKKNIYILTDDIKVVNKNIINKINDKRVKILDLDVYDSFMVMYNSDYFVFGSSTMSILGAMLRDRKDNMYLYSNKKDKYHSISKLKWNIMKVKKEYIFRKNENIDYIL